MYILALGLLLALLKYLEIGPVATVEWKWFLIPFGLTIAWWWWADSTGYTRRKAMERIEKRKQDRLDKHKAALGIQPRKPR